MSKRCAVSSKSLGGSREERERLLAEVAAAKAEKEKLVAAAETTKAENQKLRDEVKVAKDEADAIKSEADAIKSEKATLAKEVADLKKQQELAEQIAAVVLTALLKALNIEFSAGKDLPVADKKRLADALGEVTNLMLTVAQCNGLLKYACPRSLKRRSASLPRKRQKTRLQKILKSRSKTARSD